MADTTRAHQLLQTVVESDRSLWEPDSGSMTIAQRNSAVQAALAGGWTAQDVADQLGVLPGDVSRWAQDAATQPRSPLALNRHAPSREPMRHRTRGRPARTSRY